MTLAIDIINRHGLSSKAHCELLVKKLGNVHPAVKCLPAVQITNKTKHLGLKSGSAVQVTKLIK